MHYRSSTRKATSLLVLLAMLIVSVAALLPIVASADPVGYSSDIQDFGYQTLSSANPNDATTDLRFMFSIDGTKLGVYDSVGFVFSKSISTPTVGNSFYYEMDRVYPSVTANNIVIGAPEGRYWVAVKMSNILLENFGTTIYIRPFIEDDGNYSYGDTAQITVYEALTIDKAVAAESSIYDSKDPSGPYVYGVEGNHFFVSKTVGDIKGDTVFHPTGDNPDGNDLWFEYSFLWNASLANWDQSKSEMMLFGFRNASAYRDFYYLYTKDDQSEDCPYAGHIDYSTYMHGWSDAEAHQCAEDLSGQGYSLFGDPVGRYNAGWDYYHGGVKRTSSPYLYDYEWTTKGGAGWHRLGFRYHQEVKNDDPSKGIYYTGYTELYINGVKVWKVQTDMQGYWKNSTWNQSLGYGKKGYADLKANGLLLWEAKESATDEEIAAGWEKYGDLYYKDQDLLKVQARLDRVKDSTNAVYVGVADICWTCGGNKFAHPVSYRSDPLNDARTVTLGGNNYSTKIWFIYDND